MTSESFDMIDIDMFNAAIPRALSSPETPPSDSEGVGAEGRGLVEMMAFKTSRVGGGCSNLTASISRKATAELVKSRWTSSRRKIESSALGTCEGSILAPSTRKRGTVRLGELEFVC
jgi:hypothetical protein